MSWLYNYITHGDNPTHLERLRREQMALELAALRQHHADPLKKLPPGYCRVCGRPRFTTEGRIPCAC